jgi:hypothetical protein
LTFGKSCTFFLVLVLSRLCFNSSDGGLDLYNLWQSVWKDARWQFALEEAATFQVWRERVVLILGLVIIKSQNCGE